MQDGHAVRQVFDDFNPEVVFHLASQSLVFESYRDPKNTFDTNSGVVVAAKNGTKYHYPWCSGATRMKEENKIYFESVEKAREAGYEPAANCKGLE